MERVDSLGEEFQGFQAYLGDRSLRLEEIVAQKKFLETLIMSESSWERVEMQVRRDAEWFQEVARELKIVLGDS